MPTRYAIRHVTQFTYDEAVSESVMEVRMQPMTADVQQCLQFVIDVQPRARTFAYQDFLGNWVHYFNVPRRHRQLVIVARARVELDDIPPPPDALEPHTWDTVDGWHDNALHWDFRQPSAFTPWSASVREFFADLRVNDRSLDPLTTTRRVMAAIHAGFEYAPNTTRVDSPIEEAIAARRGVCQDFSHIMLAGLRHIGLPARYVSGYIAPLQAADNDPTSIATHAWVEAYLPQLGWVGFDPTHDIVAGARHVRVATGRDYADVPPTRGVFKGRAGSSLEVSVDITGAPRSPLPRADDRQGPPLSWTASRPELSDDQVQQQQQQQQ